MHPHIWPPYTQAKNAPEPLKVKSAQGVWLELEDGQRVLDVISSWWVNVHGHSHPKIAHAIAQQAQTLEHVIFAGFTHDPAEQLAERLVKKLPPGLTRVFFSDNGSTAVEVALKMAYQYWVNRQQPRRTFLAFEGAYHGDTIGAMSAGGKSIFSAVFADLLFEVESLPFPDTYWEDPAIEDKEATAIAILTQKLQQSPEGYAAILIEPLVQGAGGMRMCRPSFLQALRSLADDYQVLLIFDEVMTGFGRTGRWFASDRAQVAPDIICLSKGLTGGFLPMAVTVCRESLYDAFYGDEPQKTLYHGHSYTANPLGCAAALAGLDLMAEHEPAFRSLEALHWQQLQRLDGHPKIDLRRVTGTIAAMDLVSDAPPGYLNPIGFAIRTAAIARGVLLRPLGNVLYLMPPYCITPEELVWVYDQLEEMLSEV
jgi:adenosylmethionine---8-amino-7-oxononanoate aminotransferase